MDAAAWIALAGVALTALVNTGGYLFALGSLKGVATADLSALAERVKALEDERKAVSKLEIDVVRLETKLDALIEQFKDLAASIRWMREPADRRRVRGGA